MKNKLYYILALLCITATLASAQESISADTISGCDLLTVEFSLNNARAIESYTSVKWKFGDGITSSGTLNPSHTYEEPGFFTVICELDGGRNIVFDSQISISITPYADFSFKDTSINDSEYSYLFKPEYFKTIEGIDIDYTWRFPDETEINDSIAIYTFPEENIYQVFLSVQDINGCRDTIIKSVPVSKLLMVPNVFSPNNDGINDYFEVTTPGDYNYYFRIFTRNGLQVYASSSPFIQWDGKTIGGQDVPEGVYFYLIESDETPVETSLSGYIHLFK